MSTSTMTKESDRLHVRPPSSSSFPNLWSAAEIDRRRSELIVANLRINPRKYKDAFVSVDTKEESDDDDNKDVLIHSVEDRNTALHNDIVIVCIKERCEWRVLNEVVVEHLLKTDPWQPEDVELMKTASNLRMEPQLLTRWQQYKRTDSEEIEVEAKRKANRPKKTKCPVDDINQQLKDKRNLDNQVNKEKISQTPKKSSSNADDPEVESKSNNVHSKCEVKDDSGDGNTNEVKKPVKKVRRPPRRSRKGKDNVEQKSHPNQSENTHQVDTQNTVPPTVIPQDLPSSVEKTEKKKRRARCARKKRESVSERLQRNATEMASMEIKQDEQLDKEIQLKKVQMQSQLEEEGVEKSIESSNTSFLRHNVNKDEKMKSNETPKIKSSPAKKDHKTSNSRDIANKEDLGLSFSIESVLKHPLASKLFLQRTGVVVGIERRVHSRLAAGFIRPFNDSYALFSPKDSRVPRIKINLKECPKDFSYRPDDFQKVLFLAKISRWTQVKFALGELVKCLGDADDVQVATSGFLIEHNICEEEFSPEVLSECTIESRAALTGESELRTRRDFRSECVFTIDPLTARDLDDALSIVEEANGHLRVAIHIADVSHFVKDDSMTNEEAARRATSVYLVDRVIPMLPRPLCEDLCSLNPGVDRLTFSVEWVFDQEGNIVVDEPWFGKSVIRSCVKLAYEHAQSFIDKPTKTDWKMGTEVPDITGPFSVLDISKKVNLLQKLALKLRAKREQRGALKLDQPKLVFAMDKEKGLPIGLSLHEHRHSNRLIEEFMLLANMSVAEKIYKSFPQLAVLRRHPRPKPAVLHKVVSMLGRSGVSLNSQSSLSLAASLKPLSSHSFFPALTNLLSKPMELARYFCTGSIDDEDDYWHYALSVPYYTHFTSPIRRYPDILVHRLLYASLSSTPSPSSMLGSRTLEKLCVHCNERKLSAKTVSDKSTELHLALFIKLAGPLQNVMAIVLQVNDESVDCLMTSVASVKRVYKDMLIKHLDLKGWEYTKNNEHNLPKVKLSFPNELTLTLQPLSEVSVTLMESERPHDFTTLITGPYIET